jgi:acetyl-CoA C-acetyltransferase
MIAVLEKDIYILSARRTPIGRFNGALSPFSAPLLGGRAIEGALESARVAPLEVEMVTMGCVVTSGLGEAPAKQAALAAGIPPTVYSRTVGSVCGSGIEALVSTLDFLLLGRAQLALAGGMESRTNAPYLLESHFIRSGAHYAKGERLHLKKAGAYRWQYLENLEEQTSLSSIVDATTYDGLFWPRERKFMREYALAFAKAHKISLEEVNSQAALSHKKAWTAQTKGYSEKEIIPIENIKKDELPTEEMLRVMKEEAQTDMACAYNTSTPADNGAAVVLATKDFVKTSQAEPLARILGYSRVDGPAADFVDSPVRALKGLFAALAKKGYSEEKFDLLEINEAFGIQLPVFKQNFPEKAMNVNGGAIPLGHPFGSAGIRLLTTLLHAMSRLGVRCGALGICFGSGGSYALAVEMI